MWTDVPGRIEKSMNYRIIFLFWFKFSLHVCVIELDALMKTIETQKFNLALTLNEIQFILQFNHSVKPKHNGIY